MVTSFGGEDGAFFLHEYEWDGVLSNLTNSCTQASSFEGLEVQGKQKLPLGRGRAACRPGQG